jgi:hypothetical protein
MPEIGDIELVKPNALFAHEKPYRRKIVEVGMYPSLWLKPGEKVRGRLLRDRPPHVLEPDAPRPIHLRRGETPVEAATAMNQDRKRLIEIIARLRHKARCHYTSASVARSQLLHPEPLSILNFGEEARALTRQHVAYHSELAAEAYRDADCQLTVFTRLSAQPTSSANTSR